ncbi:hypothetical protein H5V45_08030 [Nocardioides sp. KIGAM211]|uniref:Uncharacterized protein n=1 Tax=Nocardioides luti TaxID=2761101 RepID=A0A7X0VBK1_9ACTN|nr:hypothetical protein [Nocardioides luti]MBB6627268.1 hypothetical protein [Nocardioides luti]
MSGSATPSRPATKSVGAAGVGLVATLAIFVVVFVLFLVAPLVALLLAFVVYAVMRSRDSRPAGTPADGQAPPDPAPHGFGAGAR